MTDSFRVRIGNLLHDGPAIDVLVDGYPVLTGRAPGTVNDYTVHRADTYDVAVRPAGSDDTLFEAPVTFEPDAFHTLVFYGTEGDVRHVLLEDGVVTDEQTP